ncbi:MAG: helix-turn-helix domain-containing protein [Lachnospiraceae bacterium]|nr:helix-turn-helix domain-containing protein [Lachnospiraceae bacterium]
MQKGNEKRKLPVHVIAMASIGDKEAMNEVFEQYDGLISYILIKEIKSWQLNIKLVPVEDMQQQVRADLVKAIRKFTIRY